jgi:hypothetical protein
MILVDGRLVSNAHKPWLSTVGELERLRGWTGVSGSPQPNRLSIKQT